MKKCVSTLVTLAGLSWTLTMAMAVQASDVHETYEENCAKCHGADGKGKTKMAEKSSLSSDFTDPKVQMRMKDEEMIKVIREGVKEKETGKKRMRGYDELSEAEMKQLVALIRTFAK